MKRLSILMTIVVMIGLNAFGQQQRVYSISSDPLLKVDMKKRYTQPTRPDSLFIIFHDEPCDTSFAIYTFNPASGFTGFLSGHNSFLDSAKAEYYTGITGDSIFGMYLWFGSATYTSTTQKIHAKVWDDNGPGGAPGTELANVDITQQQIKSDVDSGFFTLALFASPIPMPAGGNFYVGFRMDYKKVQGQLKYDATRAVGLVNPVFTDNTDTALNSCSDEAAENTAWTQAHYTSNGTDIYDGNWYSYWDWYGIATRNQIFPIVSHGSTCTVTITPSAPSVCKKKAVSLTASVSGGGGTWTWAPATGLNVTTGATVSAKPLTNTTYTATNSNGCSGTVTVTVNPTPTTNVTQGACSAGHILLSANANPNTGVTYRWYFNGAKITGAAGGGATYNAGASGSYKVKVTITATGCVKTSAPVNVTITCKTSNANAAAFDASAFPNPFTKSVSVNISTGSNEAATISVLDFSGRTLRNYSNVDASVPFEINENLTPGVYFVKVVQGGNEKLIKVVKSE